MGGPGPSESLQNSALWMYFWLAIIPGPCCWHRPGQPSPTQITMAAMNDLPHRPYNLASHDKSLWWHPPQTLSSLMMMLNVLIVVWNKPKKQWRRHAKLCEIVREMFIRDIYSLSCVKLWTMNKQPNFKLRKKQIPKMKAWGSLGKAKSSLGCNCRLRSPNYSWKPAERCQPDCQLLICTGFLKVHRKFWKTTYV